MTEQCEVCQANATYIGLSLRLGAITDELNLCSSCVRLLSKEALIKGLVNAQLNINFTGITSSPESPIGRRVTIRELAE